MNNMEKEWDELTERYEVKTKDEKKRKLFDNVTIEEFPSFVESDDIEKDIQNEIEKEIDKSIDNEGNE